VLPSLSPYVERSQSETRTAYESELREILPAITAGLPGSPDKVRSKAYALLAILAGGVSMARAVADQELSAEIAKAMARHTKPLIDHNH